MRLLASRPALLLVVAWIAGILAGDHLGPRPPGWTVGAVALIAVAIGCQAARLPQILALGAGLLALAAAGAARTCQVATPPPTDVSRWVGRLVSVTGTVLDEPAGDTRHRRFLMAAERLRAAGISYPVTGRLYVHAPPKPVALGERVEVSGVPERPLPATNPGGFSAAAWLRRAGCFATLRTPVLFRRGAGSLPWWRRAPVLLRQTLAAANRRAWEGTMARRGVPAPVRADLAALIQAVTFGSPDVPEADWTGLQQRFRDAGVLHVLVVSGAQVALLIWMALLVQSCLWWATISILSERKRSEVLAARLASEYGHVVQRRLSAYAALTTIWLYAAISGAEPPILRAAVTGSCYLIGLTIVREAIAENSLGAAAFLLLLWNPFSLYAPGFQLSFLAVWGLIRLGAPMEKALRPLLPGWGSPKRPPHPVVAHLRACQCDPLTWIIASIAAHFFTAGVIARSFQNLFLTGFLANLVAVPLALAVLILGLLATALNVAWQSAGLPLPPPGPLNWGNEALIGAARCLERIADFFAARGWSRLDVFPPGWIEIALSLAGLVLAGWWLESRDRRPTTDHRPPPVSTVPGLNTPEDVCRLRTGEEGTGQSPTAGGRSSVVGRRSSQPRPGRALAAGTLALLALAAGMFLPARPPRGLELTLLDVGQGDCCLARFPDGGTLLIDGGGTPFSDFDAGERIVAPALRALRVGHLDVIVLSHAHEDHVGGLPAVLRQFPVGQVLEAGGPVDAASYAAFRALIRERRIPYTRARRGTRITFGARSRPRQPPAATLEVLHPPERLLSATGSDVNNNSLVLRLTAGGTRVLFAGDAETAAEAAMRGLDLRAALLKVGHHGSRTSTGEPWLAAVGPRLALISCGRHNRFGHPHPATLARLHRHGVTLFRTDRDGAVSVTARAGRLEARGMLALDAPR